MIIGYNNFQDFILQLGVFGALLVLANDIDSIARRDACHIARVLVILDEQHKRIRHHLDRDQGPHRRDHLLDWRNDLGVCKRRRHSIDADPVGKVLERAGEPNNTKLGGRVDGGHGLWVQPGQGGRVDDDAGVVLLLEGVDPQTGALDHGGEVNVDDLFPDPGLVGPEGRVLGDAGIVDDDVDAAKVLEGCGEEGGLLVVFGHVALDKVGDFFFLAVLFLYDHGRSVRRGQ